ncbi:MAG: lipoprotein insertase outer membrane protein LolB [Pseudomonadales bacterium]
MLRGKLGVVQEQESFSARFYWRQSGSNFNIDLWGPLGQGRISLAGNPRYLELQDGEGAIISQGPPDIVMEQQLGWSLPLSVLPEWIQGRPAPGLPVHEPVYDAEGRLIAFGQLNWRVELERYQRVDGDQPLAIGVAAAAAPGGFLPHRVTATRDAYRVRLAISSWQI